MEGWLVVDCANCDHPKVVHQKKIGIKKCKQQGCPCVFYKEKK